MIVLYIALICLAGIALGLGIVFGGLKLLDRSRSRPRIVPDDEKECDISVVVVQGRQDHLLLIDDVNKRLIKMHLMPGMRVAAVGVGRRDKEGALCVKAREVDSFDDEDFEDIKQETYFN
jgi:hypothetical protein